MWIEISQKWYSWYLITAAKYLDRWIPTNKVAQSNYARDHLILVAIPVIILLQESVNVHLMPSHQPDVKVEGLFIQVVLYP